MGAAGLDVAARVALWDAVLAALRARARATGLHEVSTRVRVEAGAIEPYIQPVASEGGWLRTSPELEMKQLLARGAPDLFQIGAVFRRGERGVLHREEFHLLEWYRAGEGLADAMADVEGFVQAVFGAAAGICRRDPAAPRRWERVDLVSLMRETLRVETLDPADPESVRALLSDVRRCAGLALPPTATDVRSTGRASDPELELLAAWTELFSLWSDRYLTPWLQARPDVGVHLHAFPPALAALARVDGERALRFETHVAGIELANGYEELRDPVEQRRRFENVDALHGIRGSASRPLPHAFLAALAAPGLPPCRGVAMGIERAMVAATGARDVSAIELP
jgi:lysyl-tRNA synthetase class 2